MKSAVYLLAVLALTRAAPAPAAQPEPAPAAQPDPADDNRPEIIEIIAPAASAQVPYLYTHILTTTYYCM